MGSIFQATCKTCQHSFCASQGGGFDFVELRCCRCGQSKVIEDEGNWDTYPPDEYYRRIEEVAVTCHCGGRFTFDAPLRCPKCGSTEIERGEDEVLND